MVKKINEAEFRAEALVGTALVDFSAVWCGPCKMMHPVLETLSEEMKDSMRFYEVDVDENMALAIEYGISSIPALVILKDGKEQDMLVGFRPKQELEAELKRFV